MFILRDIYNKLSQQKDNHAVSVLIGARQVGKSTLLSHLAEEFNVSCRYINLENPLHLNIFSEGYTSFIKEVPENIVFIDEFHYYSNITSVFKAVYDLCPEKKIYASGSSSLEMYKHLKESLVGRQIYNDIYPLSFSEWLSQYDLSLPQRDEYLSLDLKNTLDTHLDTFLIYGAMPGLVHIRDDLGKREYLFNIYKTYIAKDIKAFLKEESILSFNKIIEYLAINNTCQLNVQTLSKLGGISVRQINRYLEILEGTYVLGLLRPFYNNKTKEITKTSKIYFYDQGIANVIIKDFRNKDVRLDGGAIVEQFVYWEIIKSLDIRYSLKYWRTADQHEVDFILEKDRSFLPIEVKTSWDITKVPKGLKAFLKCYPQTKEAVILADCQESSFIFGNTKIYFMPWYMAGYLKTFL